jgi:hypothetical protein
LAHGAGGKALLSGTTGNYGVTILLPRGEFELDAEIRSGRPSSLYVQSYIHRSPAFPHPRRTTSRSSTGRLPTEVLTQSKLLTTKSILRNLTKPFTNKGNNLLSSSKRINAEANT